MTAVEVDAALEPTREQIKAAQNAYAEAIAGRPEFRSPYWISWSGMKAALTAARAVARPDPIALPMDELPEGWFWELRDTFYQGDQKYFCRLMNYAGEDEAKIDTYGPTPRAAFLAAVAAAREG